MLEPKELYINIPVTPPNSRRPLSPHTTHQSLATSIERSPPSSVNLSPKSTQAHASPDLLPPPNLIVPPGLTDVSCHDSPHPPATTACSGIIDNATIAAMLNSQYRQNEAILASLQTFSTERTTATTPPPLPTLSSTESFTDNPTVVSTFTPTTRVQQPQIKSTLLSSLFRIPAYSSHSNDSSLRNSHVHSNSSMVPIQRLMVNSPSSKSSSDIEDDREHSSSVHFDSIVGSTTSMSISNLESDRNDNYTSICRRNLGKDIETGMGTWKGSTRNLTISRSIGLTHMVRWGARLWVSYFFFVSLAISVQLILGSGDWAFPDCNGCSNEEGEQTNAQICNLSISLKQAVLQLYFLSPFILGGFLLSSVRLWQTRRTAYTMLCGATRNMLINLCTIISDPNDKRLVSRWAVLGYELAVLKGRGLIESDEGKVYLLKLKLLQGDEWDAMVKGDRHTTVFYWIQMKAMKLTKNNVISQIEFQTICNAVTLLRDKANDLMSPIDRDQPSPYISLCGMLVNINLLLYSLSNGVDWAIWMHETEGGILREPRTYIQVFCLFLYTTIYAMLFDVCGLLYNPFGPREVDINHYEVSKGIRRLANELSSRCMLPVTMDNVQYDESLFMLDELGVSISQFMNPAQQRRESYFGVLNSSILLKNRGSAQYQD